MLNINNYFNTNNVHPSWLPLLERAFTRLDAHYIEHLQQSSSWLPGKEMIFNAFSLPLTHTRYILFGESPYPRAESANGYAFWDNAVSEIWSKTGLHKPVNRATSLRNFIKMLLVADNQIVANNSTQPAIASVDKGKYIKTIAELFQNMQDHGILLLNASLVLSDLGVNKDAKNWQPFMACLLTEIARIRQDIHLILLGNIAKRIKSMEAAEKFQHFQAEHPYNVSFISNIKVLEFFRPFELLNGNKVA